MIAATGNETLTSLLDGLSGRTVRAGVWRGLLDGNAAHIALSEHEAIYRALVSRDPQLAQATALMHASTSDYWLRRVLSTTVQTDGKPHGAMVGATSLPGAFGSRGYR